MRSRPPLIALAAIAALSLCPPPATAAPRTHVPTTHVIVIDKMKFGALPAGLRAGDRLVWVNKDMFKHTATARDGSFDLDLPPGTRRSAVVKKAGALAVICRYHPGMRIMLQVKK